MDNPISRLEVRVSLRFGYSGICARHPRVPTSLDYLRA
jgi:hypothetical protein